jgi:hypothetical protein
MIYLSGHRKLKFSSGESLINWVSGVMKLR